jgi:hypothetical protein
VGWPQQVALRDAHPILAQGGQLFGVFHPLGHQLRPDSDGQVQERLEYGDTAAFSG